jgi:hypothetical protein
MFVQPNLDEHGRAFMNLGAHEHERSRMNFLMTGIVNGDHSSSKFSVPQYKKQFLENSVLIKFDSFTRVYSSNL